MCVCGGWFRATSSSFHLSQSLGHVVRGKVDGNQERKPPCPVWRIGMYLSCRHEPIPHQTFRLVSLISLYNKFLKHVCSIFTWFFFFLFSSRCRSRKWVSHAHAYLREWIRVVWHTFWRRLSSSSRKIPLRIIFGVFNWGLNATRYLPICIM